jgi:hypothetical protein
MLTVGVDAMLSLWRDTKHATKVPAIFYFLA